MIQSSAIKNVMGVIYFKNAKKVNIDTPFTYDNSTDRREYKVLGVSPKQPRLKDLWLLFLKQLKKEFQN